MVNRVLTKVENDALEPLRFIWFLSSQTGPGTTSEASRPYVSYGFLTSILHSCKSEINPINHMVNRKVQKVKTRCSNPFVFLSQMSHFALLGRGGGGHTRTHARTHAEIFAGPGRPAAGRGRRHGGAGRRRSEKSAVHGRLHPPLHSNPM